MSCRIMTHSYEEYGIPNFLNLADTSLAELELPSVNDGYGIS